MVTNPHISNLGYKGEQDLFSDLILESIQMFGHDFYYIPRDVISEDMILGDDIASAFAESYVIEMYIENIEAWDGAGDIFQKIGYEIRDEAQLVMSRRRWEQALQGFGPHSTLTRPREGDLLFLPLSNHLFEIMHVEHEFPFHALNNLPVYRLSVSTFENNGEVIDVDIEGLDIHSGDPDFVAIENLGYKMELTTATAGLYEIGETVSQTLTDKIITGEVVHLDGTKVTVAHIANDSGGFGLFVTGTNLVGARSAVTLDVTAVLEVMAVGARNDNFETEGDALIDFTVTNPFGEP